MQKVMYLVILGGVDWPNLYIWPHATIRALNRGVEKEGELGPTGPSVAQKNANLDLVKAQLEKVEISVTWRGTWVDERDIYILVNNAIKEKLKNMADEGLLDFIDEDIPDPDTVTIVKTVTDEVVRNNWCVDVIAIGDDVYDVWVEDLVEYHWGENTYRLKSVYLAPHHSGG